MELPEDQSSEIMRSRLNYGYLVDNEDYVTIFTEMIDQIVYVDLCDQ